MQSAGRRFALICSIDSNAQRLRCVINSLCDAQAVAQPCKCCVFALIPHKLQRMLQNCACFLMHNDVTACFCIVIPGVALPVVSAVVRHAGGAAVADHFGKVAHRHLAAVGNLRRQGREVNPVFKMVPVPAFVVQPCAGAAEQLPLDGVGRTEALIIADAGNKFGRGKF